jgi:hypothetical protein
MRYVFSTIVNTLICATQLGACTAYVLFIAENVHDVSNYWPQSPGSRYLLYGLERLLNT